MSIQKEITLSQEQMSEAAAVARKLHGKLRLCGVKNAHGLRDRDATRELEEGGAQAELAAALMLGVEWTASTHDDPYGPDIGRRTQVRSSNKPRRSHCLIVRPRDLQKYGNVPFLLVIQTGNTFRIHGWMMAAEAAQPKYLWNGGDRRRPDVWFVPERFLHQIENLEGV